MYIYIYICIYIYTYIYIYPYIYLATVADLSFATKELHANTYNIQSEVLQGAMDAIFESDVLSEMWTGREFTFIADNGDTPIGRAHGRVPIVRDKGSQRRRRARAPARKSKT